MNQRQALVAYEQSNGRYNIHRSPALGGNLELVERLELETPYGGGTSGYEPSIVEEEPIECGVSLQETIDKLDFSRFGAVVVVSAAFEVTPYRATWFGLREHSEVVYDSDAFGNGALVQLELVDGNIPDDNAFCAGHEAKKRTLGGLVDDGVLAAHEAQVRLREEVAAYADDGYEVVFASGLNPRSAEASLVDRVASSGRRLIGR